ncbi:hypothetical protein ACO2Q7_14935 [Rathayibacter sp. KR2-224]|uniref:hypothetical protein n=1 Tax=Rathayibacter sp. KR2-224 TaxID=3400913 RepID=UPI003C0948B7
MQPKSAGPQPLGSALSPYWGVNISVQDGVETHALYAKRPDAAEREPLTLTTELTFASDDEALRQAFLDKLNYGTSARVVLPSNVVRRFAIKGAPWIATESTGGELELIAPPSDLAGHNVYMTTRDADGQVLDEISGVASHVGSGTNGVSLEMSFPGGLTQVWRFSGTQDEMTSQVNFNMAGQSGRSAARAHQFVSTFDNASTVEIELDGRTMKMVLTDTALRSPDAGVASFVDDLAFIERELNVEFAFPDGETGVIDRIWTRVIRRILEGRAVLVPLGVTGYSATLTGEESDGLEDMLTKGGQVVVTHFDWRFTLFGTRLRLGAVSYYHPNLQVADGAGHLAAIRAGAGAGRKTHFTAENDMPFTIVSTTRLDGDGVSVEPWGIPGVPEHPTLAVVQARTKTIPVPPRELEP